MKQFPAISLSMFSVGLALSASHAWADDPASPPAAPAAPANSQTSPGAGDEPTPTPGPQHHRRMSRGYVLEDLTDKLTLTADQQKSVGGIIESGRSQAKALHGDDSLSGEDKRAKMRAIMTSTHDQIRAALTPDQQKIFDTLPAPGGGKPKNQDNN
jgi:hypothetical protein